MYVGELHENRDEKALVENQTALLVRADSAIHLRGPVSVRETLSFQRRANEPPESA